MFVQESNSSTCDSPHTMAACMHTRAGHECGKITADSPSNMIEDSVTVPMLPNVRSAVVHSTEDVSDCDSDDSLNFFHAQLFKENSEDSLPNLQETKKLSPSKRFSPSKSLHVVENPASMSHTCDTCTVDIHEEVSLPSPAAPPKNPPTAK